MEAAVLEAKPARQVRAPQVVDQHIVEIVSDSGTVLIRCEGNVHTGRPANAEVRFTCPAQPLSSGTVFMRVYELPLASDAAPMVELAVQIKRQPS